MRWAIVAGFLLSVAPAPGAAFGPPTNEAVSPQARGAAAVIDAFHAALHRGDTAGAATLLASEAIIFEGGHVERSKAEYSAHHLGADAGFASAVPSKITRRTGSAGANMAWIATEGRTTGKFKGKDVDSITTETAILKRVGTSWKIVHLHWSSHKAATAD